VRTFLKHEDLEPGRTAGYGRRLRLQLVAGAVLLCGLILFSAFHAREEERFAFLVLRARPRWLLLGIALQALTYCCAAAVWAVFLVRAGYPTPPGYLIRAAVSRLTVDQIAPSLGLSGRLLVIRSLTTRGVPVELATGAVLIDLLTNYAAHSMALLGTLALLWMRRQLSSVLLSATTPFLLFAAGLPVVLLWIVRRSRKPARWRVVRRVTELAGRVPGRLLWDPRSWVICIALQLAVFLLDAATLSSMLLAVGQPPHLAVTFASVVVAEMAATMGMIPGGIGTFETACVAMLTLEGAPINAALAATLLLRGFTLWLPLLPGLWFSHQVAGRRGTVERRPGGGRTRMA
jgi:uncharacterized membrane protein YbhN (UPF0104 family)